MHLRIGRIAAHNLCSSWPIHKVPASLKCDASGIPAFLCIFLAGQICPRIDCCAQQALVCRVLARTVERCQGLSKVDQSLNSN